METQQVGELVDRPIEICRISKDIGSLAVCVGKYKRQTDDQR
jgi:hypothetical protein